MKALIHLAAKGKGHFPGLVTMLRRKRRLLTAFAGSALLHLVGVFLYFQLFQDSLVSKNFPAVLLAIHPEISRFVPHQGVSIPQNALTRPQDATIQLPSTPLETGAEPQVAPLAPALPEERLGAPVAVPGQKDWLVQSDKVDVQRDTLDRHRSSRPLDWAEAHALGKHHTAVLVDPQTGRLKKAYLHVPSYLGGAGNGLAKAMDMIERGFQLSSRVPIEIDIHYYRLGPSAHSWIPTEREPFPDPVHRFPLHYMRETLAYQEMVEYPLIEMRTIDPASTEVMVRYLLNGGFALNGTVGYLYQKLRERVGDSVQVEHLGLDHPVFKAFYKIEAYKEPNTLCPGIYPLSGLSVQGRLVAVANLPGFNPDYPCKSNEVYVNAIVYGLVQSVLDGGLLAGEPGPRGVP